MLSSLPSLSACPVSCHRPCLACCWRRVSWPESPIPSVQESASPANPGSHTSPSSSFSPREPCQSHPFHWPQSNFLLSSLPFRQLPGLTFDLSFFQDISASPLRSTRSEHASTCRQRQQSFRADCRRLQLLAALGRIERCSHLQSHRRDTISTARLLHHHHHNVVNLCLGLAACWRSRHALHHRPQLLGAV